MSTPGCWTSGLWSLRISSCGFKTPGVRIFAAAASEHVYNREGPQPIPQTTVSVRVRGEQADGRVSRHEWWGLLSGEAPGPRESCSRAQTPRRVLPKQVLLGALPARATSLLQSPATWPELPQPREIGWGGPPALRPRECPLLGHPLLPASPSWSKARASHSSCRLHRYHPRGWVYPP